MTMHLVTLDTLTASHHTHEQWIDTEGIEWICTRLDGWGAAPARETRHETYATGDGALRSAAYRGTRSFELVGRYFAPDLAVGLRAERAVAALCPDPGAVYPLTVTDPAGSLTAWVEQAGEIMTGQFGPLGWDWSVPLVSADPYRHDTTWVSTVSEAPQQGTGGISFTGSGASFASPGLAMGTADVEATATVIGSGTVTSDLVFQVAGPAFGVEVDEQGTSSVLGVRGTIQDGESMWINPGLQPARDVPGCPLAIPPRGAIVGTSSARGALRITGGWPELPASATRTYRMTGTTGDGARFTVHTRGAYV